MSQRGKKPRRKDAPDNGPEAFTERGGALFVQGIDELQRGKFKKAEASFAGAEDNWAHLPTHRQSLLVAKTRRAAALIGRKRWTDALAVLDEVLASGAVMSDLPDELPAVYWARAVCLENLGRLDESSIAIGDLIREVGSGTTVKQRTYVARAFLMQARAAEAKGQIDQAVKAVDAAITHGSQDGEPGLLSEAQRLRTVLLEKA